MILCDENSFELFLHFVNTEKNPQETLDNHPSNLMFIKASALGWGLGGKVQELQRSSTYQENSFPRFSLFVQMIYEATKRKWI